VTCSANLLRFRMRLCELQPHPGMPKGFSKHHHWLVRRRIDATAFQNRTCLEYRWRRSTLWSRMPGGSAVRKGYSTSWARMPGGSAVREELSTLWIRMPGGSAVREGCSRRDVIWFYVQCSMIM